MSDNYLDKGRVNQKQETRRKILDSAQDLLMSGKEINLEDVAEHAGISRATIYRYYSNAEVLAGEAGLDLSTKAPEEIVGPLSDRPTIEQVRAVQDYFNTLTLDHEQAFRTYLSSIIAAPERAANRGARRIRTLDLVFEHSEIPIKQKQDLIHLLTMLMGIEPVIVAKDVAHLDNRKSKELLAWGVELIMEGLASRHGDSSF